MLLKIFFTVCLLLFSVIPLKADEAVYVLYDFATGDARTIASYDDLTAANKAYYDQKDEYGNLVLMEKDRVLLMEYGIVEFNTSNDCALNLEYRDENGQKRMLNGCYGIDALYLADRSDLETIGFMMADSYGAIGAESVTLHPYENLTVRPSLYSVENGSLYHDVKAQLQSDYYAYHIPVNKAPAYLSDGTYYSYDGHYFYDDFYKLSDDANKGVSNNAINSNEPFYNYYAYLPHRSISNYSFNELSTYFSQNFAFDKRLYAYSDTNLDNANDVVNRSQYVGVIDDFFAYQYLYGANAMMMLSLSINESAYGKNAMAYNINNLFGHVAFDNDQEREEQKYSDVASSIYSHARYYISNRYSNPRASIYHGSFFGDKSSGMNVEYAIDPYWGEKSAGNYYQLDSSLGMKDSNAYALGIKTTDGSFRIYKDSDLTSLMYNISDIQPYSVIILEKIGQVYKIQVDRLLGTGDRYYFTESIGYVAADSFDIILNEQMIKEKKYYTITFNGAGGSFDGDETVVIKVPEGQIPVMITPELTGYEFAGYDSELLAAFNDATYTASYRKIATIEVAKTPSAQNELHQPINLEDGKIKIIYDDGEEKEIDINTDMIFGYDPDMAGEQTVTVSYCGLTSSYVAVNSEQLADNRQFVKENLAEFIADYEADGTYDETLFADLLAKLKTIDYPLDANTIRVLDQIASSYYSKQVSLSIDENRFDLNISGMYLAIDFGQSINNERPLFKDTYRIAVSAVSSLSYAILNQVGTAYGLQSVESFALSFYRNYENIDTNFPFVVSLKLDELNVNKIYTVYHLNENGDVTKCKTTQTENYIQFIADDGGEFMVFAVDTLNSYELANTYENLTGYNDDAFYFEYVIDTVIPIVAVVLDEILLLVYLVNRKKGDRLWNGYKNSLQNAESVRAAKPKS